MDRVYSSTHYEFPYRKSRLPDKPRGKMVKVHFEPGAAIIRKISIKSSGRGRPPRWPSIHIMSDGTFRVYPSKEGHFAIGVAKGKTDEEIRQEANGLIQLIQDEKVHLFRKNGTIYKSPPKKIY